MTTAAMGSGDSSKESVFQLSEIVVMKGEGRATQSERHPRGFQDPGSDACQLIRSGADIRGHGLPRSSRQP